MSERPLCAAVTALLSLAAQTPQLAVASRRSVLATSTVAVLSPAAAGAFNLPPPTEASDPEKRRAYAAMENPEPFAQQNPAFFAVTNGDMESLQAMADSGWALTELADDAGGEGAAAHCR